MSVTVGFTQCVPLAAGQTLGQIQGDTTSFGHTVGDELKLRVTCGATVVSSKAGTTNLLTVDLGLGVWPFACAIGTFGQGLYCDPATGLLKTSPDHTAVVSRSVIDLQPPPGGSGGLAGVQPAGAQGAFRSLSSPVITNPSCRTMQVTHKMNTDINMNSLVGDVTATIIFAGLPTSRLNYTRTHPADVGGISRGSRHNIYESNALLATGATFDLTTPGLFPTFQQAAIRADQGMTGGEISGSVYAFISGVTQ